MNTRMKIISAAWLCALLITGLLSSNLFSIIPSGTTSAKSLQQGGEGSPESLSAQQLAAREMTRSLVELNTRYQLAGKAVRKHLLDNFHEVVASRQQMLVELIESDPGEVLRVALPASISQYLPSGVRDKVEQQVEIEGELEVTYEDWEDGS